MRALILTAGALALGQTLATDYEQATRLRVDATTSFSVESTRRMERDGQPVEGRGGGGASTSSETRHIVLVDEYLEKAEGRPTHVRRSFHDVSFEGEMSFGDQSRELERDSPFGGIVIDLVVDEDGDVAVEVTEGSAPDDELLEGHLPDLALDAFLPEGEVDAGDSWELDGDQIARALGFDIAESLFPRPEPEDFGGGEGRGGGRGRGGFGRGGGQSVARLFTMGEWQGEATLESLDEDHEGVTCALIKIEIEGQGELPEPEFGGRGRFAAGPASVAAGENEFEIEAEGHLYYSLADKRPVHFELEGKLGLERRMERNSERGSMVISTTEEGTFTQTVTITAEESE